MLFFFAAILDSYAVARNSREVPCALYIISPNGNILQNYSIISYILEILIPRKMKKREVQPHNFVCSRFVVV